MSHELTTPQKVSKETMRFMRGKYVCDEVGNGKDELKFRRGGKTILTIYIRDGRYDFLVIFGKTEREKFEALRDEFPRKIQELYDKSKTYHDGKWITVPVADLETLEAVKQLVIIKKKPNRKPFPKDQAIYGECGHRCDLCIHYTGETLGKEFMAEIRERAKRVYGMSDEDALMRCPGCHNKPKDDLCYQKKCAKDKRVDKCSNCKEYLFCDKAVAGKRAEITSNSILADDVTWAILPYVHGQYGN